jgi:hypothetical protein
MQNTRGPEEMSRDRLEMIACLRTLNSFKASWKPVVRDNPVTGTLSLKFVDRQDAKKFMIKKGTTTEFEAVAGVNYSKVK